MKARLASIAVAMMVVTAPAWAAENPVRELARETGLSERKVQMILGTRTAFAEYTYTYDRALEKFKAGIGEERYQRLISGERVTLPSGVEVQVRVAAR